MIKDKIKDQLIKQAAKHIITDLRIGLKYTYIELDNEQSGVAYTPKNEYALICRGANDDGLFLGKTADITLLLLGGSDQLMSSVGLATANALINNTNQDVIEGDIMKFIKLHEDDKVAMIGCFAPIMQGIRSKTTDMFVFDKIESKVTLPLSSLEDKLPECNVAVVTATSIIDNDIDKYLDLTAHCREVILLGPSLPLMPDVFSSYNITLLSGVQVVNNYQIKNIISHGHGMCHFKKNIRKVNIALVK